MTTATREVASTRAPSTLHAKQSTIVRRSGRDRRIVYMTDQSEPPLRCSLRDLTMSNTL